MSDDYLTLTAAAQRAGISRVTLWRLVKAGQLPTYTSPRDRRATLVRWEELAALLQPVPRKTTGVPEPILSTPPEGTPS